ncbi:1-deoxy-D-xylulose-5-phosphate reductoisomerase [Sutcliffiella rhizosphaerae]|uniref:1-deoxy-D-xylulose 5-phosphate reductoisomerase n=1 Tax=Sutcliffiella rhizosphaerae TaxID=2880967 RepID=A0ABN8A3V7_9BACI|nr:1-deoxy-D-xylulose-5-phosphate reductoisomerase [Sutcliffiella rhizosphaerae]CAG9619679.1 1-deoxy-D-xylulose 5-phosphate reductoisomerase [Sutcliffiella rhizosphaerae]
MRNISLLGASGSIGIQTIDVIRQHPEHFQLVAFSVGKNIEIVHELLNEFTPKIISVQSRNDYETLKFQYAAKNIRFVYGEEGLIEVAVAQEADVLVNAVMGSVGLEPTLHAIELGRVIALANKETLVTAGHIVMEAAKKYNATILPVDSEHSAIFQCLQGEKEKNVQSIILTASGGSFRDKSREDLKGVTRNEALNHPNWSMGAKITIDSATMMNKGLEVIEAHWLFNTSYENIQVVLHRESVIHSMIEFHDTSVIAQLGTPDMRVPIQYALTFPDRLPHPTGKRLNFTEIGKLHFEKMDFNRFLCLQYAFDAGKAGGTMPTVLNASNEVAVEAFLTGKIDFLTIEQLIESAMARHSLQINPDLYTIKEVDKETRQFVRSLLD